MTVTRETPASKQWPNEVAAMGTAAPVQRGLTGKAPGTGLATEPAADWTAGPDVESGDAGAAGLPPGFDKLWTRLFFGVVVLATVGIGVGWYLVPHDDRPTPVRSALRAEALAPVPEPVVAAPAAATPASPPLAATPASPAPEPLRATAAVPPPPAEDNRPAAQVIAEMTAPQELVVAAAHKMDQGDPFAALQLLLRGDAAGWAPASLELGRMYDPTLRHRFDVPSPDLGYAVERYIRARNAAADPQTAQDARARLDAIKAALDKGRATDPAAAAVLGKYFR